VSAPGGMSLPMSHQGEFRFNMPFKMNGYAEYRGGPTPMPGHPPPEIVVECFLFEERIYPQDRTIRCDAKTRYYPTKWRH
jgi:hypothetical protein